MDNESIKRKCIRNNNNHPAQIEGNKIELALRASLNGILSSNELQSALCEQCQITISQGQALIKKYPLMEDPYKDLDLSGGYGILRSFNTSTYYSQAAFGPSDLPDSLRSWEESYTASLLSKNLRADQEYQQSKLKQDLGRGLYGMQPQRPCSSATGRALVNVVPVCQDGDCRSEDPGAGKGKSSFDWSRPLSQSQKNNNFLDIKIFQGKT